MGKQRESRDSIQIMVIVFLYNPIFSKYHNPKPFQTISACINKLCKSLHSRLQVVTCITMTSYLEQAIANTANEGGEEFALAYSVPKLFILCYSLLKCASCLTSLSHCSQYQHLQHATVIIIKYSKSRNNSFITHYSQHQILWILIASHF